MTWMFDSRDTGARIARCNLFRCVRHLGAGEAGPFVGTAGWAEVDAGSSIVGKLAPVVNATAQRPPTVTRCRLLESPDQSVQSGQSKDIEARVTEHNTGILLPGSASYGLLLNLFLQFPSVTPGLKRHVASDAFFLFYFFIFLRTLPMWNSALHGVSRAY